MTAIYVRVAREQAHTSLVAPRQQRGIARIRASVLSRSPSCWRLCCSLNRPSGVCSVMSNRYGITLDSEWIEWAAKEEVSETVAAAVLLICETRPVHEVVAKLTPGEFERVVDIVRRSPDHFPSGTLAALKSRSPMPARRPQSDSVFRGHMRAWGTSTGRCHWIPGYSIYQRPHKHQRIEIAG